VLQRVLLTALTAGLLAGLLVSVLQATRVTPLILAAELYEAPAPAHDAHDRSTWAPEDGIERTAYTVVANLLIGVGFGLLLAAGFALYGGPVDLRTGVLWGLAGFAAFALAPAFGLPPEPPGMAAADLASRQAWWLGTAAATAGGLALIAYADHPVAKASGVVAIALPHLIGAPHPEIVEASALPAAIAARFVAASLVTSAVFWVVLGGLSGWLYRRLVLGLEP
jgi:cobalt transporter subunit CbtA